MSSNAVALVACPGISRAQLAKHLRAGGYDVFECDDLAIPGRFVGVVLVDDDQPFETVRASVQTWLRTSRPPRVVVVSPRPARWRALSLAHLDHLYIVVAPSFSWEIVDALRATRPVLPRA